MMPSPSTTPPAPARRSRPGALARTKERVGQWLIDLEYRLRNARPFAHGRGSARVFYPGCSLPAADPELVLRAYEWLKARDPEIELWSDCCGMPLEKFSSKEAAERGRAQTREKLRRAGTTEIITACGNCTVQFQSLKVPGLQLTSLYGLLAEEDWGERPNAAPSVVHHPCSARIDKGLQVDFKRFADRLHLNVVNIDDPKHPLSCCLVKSPAALAKREALADSQLVTYCAHCTMSFQKDIPTRHVLQEVFGKPEERWQPKGPLARFAAYRRFSQLATRAGEKARASAPPSDAPSDGRLSWGARLAIAALVAAVLVMVARHGALSQRALQLIAYSRDAGPLGIVAYALAYVVATVLLLPGSALTLGAGFAWGPFVGVAIVSPVSVVAATAAFALGRTLLRARVERHLSKHPKLAALDRAVGDHGLRLVLLLRLSPIVPFNALNYALAATRVRLFDYVVGSAIGMLPGTVLYVYLGSLVTSGTELLAGRPMHSAAATALYWGGLVATLLVVVLTTRLARAELDKLLGQEAP